jgi:hypothetical protein
MGMQPRGTHNSRIGFDTGATHGGGIVGGAGEAGRSAGWRTPMLRAQFIARSLKRAKIRRQKGGADLEDTPTTTREPAHRCLFHRFDTDTREVW